MGVRSHHEAEAGKRGGGKGNHVARAGRGERCFDEEEDDVKNFKVGAGREGGGRHACRRRVNDNDNDGPIDEMQMRAVVCQRGLRRRVRALYSLSLLYQTKFWTAANSLAYRLLLLDHTHSRGRRWSSLPTLLRGEGKRWLPWRQISLVLASMHAGA